MTRGSAVEAYQSPLPGIADPGEVFRRLYYHLYSNSRASRAEKIHEDLSLLLLLKLALETNGHQHLLDRYLSGDGSANDAFLPVLRKAYPNLVDPDRRFSLEDDSLRTALGDLAGIKLSESPAHVLGEAFQALIGPRLRGERGQFFTPRSLVRAMIEVAAPQPDESVLDPACGTGGFLVETFSYQERHGRRHGGRLVGVEKDDGLAGLAGSLLAVTTRGAGNIYSFDSLDERQWTSMPGKRQLTYDLVITNPPFGAKIGIRNQDILRSFQLGHQWIEEDESSSWFQTGSLLPTQDPQILFLELCVRRLKPGGRLAIVLPEGVFGNRSTGYIWEWLRTQGEVYGLLDCPRTTFQPGTDTKTNVLFFRRATVQSLPSSGSHVRVGVALHCGHDRRGRTTRSDGLPCDDDFAILGPAFHVKNSKDWSNVAITNRNYLVPRYYLGQGPVSRDEAAFVAGAKSATLGELVSQRMLTIAKGHEVGSEAYGTGDVPFVRTSDLSNFEIRVDPTNGVSDDVYQQYASQQHLTPGDILLVVDGRYRIGTSAIVTETNYRCVVQSHLRILSLRPASELSPYALLYALNLPSVKLRIRNLVFVQSTLGTLGKRLLELRIPLLRGRGPWTEQVKAFEGSLRERDRILRQLLTVGGSAVEL